MATTATLTPTAELFQQIGSLADDDNSIRRLLRYARRLAAERQQVSKEKQEIIDNLRESFHELKLYKEGKIKFLTQAEFEAELERDGHSN